MHITVKNLLNIQNNIKENFEKSNVNNNPKIIAVSKTFSLDKIMPLIEFGHNDFGENKVQEAIEKWTEFKKTNLNINLHMIGKLQTNKVKFAVQLFDYIHSVDSQKLAKKIADEQIKIKRQINIFIQVNIGDENQKSGIDKKDLGNLVTFCKKTGLNLVGLMCIPPANSEPDKFFNQMLELQKKYDLKELSMGMSSDYLRAINYSATYLRIGSKIFGERS